MSSSSVSWLAGTSAQGPDLTRSNDSLLRGAMTQAGWGASDTGRMGPARGRRCHRWSRRWCRHQITPSHQIAHAHQITPSHQVAQAHQITPMRLVTPRNGPSLPGLAWPHGRRADAAARIAARMASMSLPFSTKATAPAARAARRIPPRTLIATTAQPGCWHRSCTSARPVAASGMSKSTRATNGPVRSAGASAKARARAAVASAASATRARSASRAMVWPRAARTRASSSAISSRTGLPAPERSWPGPVRAGPLAAAGARAQERETGNRSLAQRGAGPRAVASGR